VGYEAIPESLRTRPQWLVWRFEDNGEKKPRKVPYYTVNHRRVGEQGTPQDREKLRTLDQAIAAAKKLQMDGIGFAFLPGDGLIGIDIDGAIDMDTGEVAERARTIIDACNSYTEYSPSGKGVHIIVAGESETFKSNKIGLEVFCGSQFFTFTGKQYSGAAAEVRPIAPAVLRRLRATVDEAKGRRKLESIPGKERIAAHLVSSIATSSSRRWARSHPTSTMKTGSTWAWRSATCTGPPRASTCGTAGRARAPSIQGARASRRIGGVGAPESPT
jgi:hypothetical protein